MKTINFSLLFLIIGCIVIAIALPLDTSTDDEESFSIDMSRWMSLIEEGNQENKTAERIQNLSPPDDKMNPEELGAYPEGDIFVSKNQLRNGMVSVAYRWTNGIVPYVIEPDFDANELAIMKYGFAQYAARTCVRFVPRTNQNDYISFSSRSSGCFSNVGRIGGKQIVNMQRKACFTQVGTFMHECMHALGFLHEQNRSERDSYVTIHYENIQPGVNNNFDKASPYQYHGFGVGYDVGSIMHYSPYAFSKNGKPTITQLPSTPRSASMGQRSGFTQKDVDKINAMYKCTNRVG